MQRRTYYDENNPWDIPCVFPAIRELNGSEKAISFNYAMTYKGDKDETICHFFVDDYQFERVWTSPDKYIPMLRRFKAVAAPDFSVSDDFPTAIKIYNVYRKAWLTRYFQEQGVCMLPTAEWGGEDTLEYAFAGIPKHSPVCVTAAGVVQNKLERQMFEAGLNEKPQVLDNAQFSQFMKDNNLSTSDLISRDINPITYKNNSGTNVKMTADDVADMMMYSRYNYIGGKVNGQALGAGTYFDHVNGGSTGYGGRNSKTVVGVLNPATARPISSRNLASQAQQFAQTHPQFAKAVGAYNTSFSGGKNNMSIYALAMGYNVIMDSGGYTNVIDRSAIVYRK